MFVIIGNGRYKDKFLSEISEAKVEDMFVIIDRQPFERIPLYLSKCDVAYLSFMNNPLFEKSIPAKLQTYLSCGMPVIASANGETERIINEAKCGKCFGIGDAEALANGIIALSKSEDLQEMGKRAKAYSEQYFDKAKLMDEMDAMLLQ